MRGVCNISLILALIAVILQLSGCNSQTVRAAAVETPIVAPKPIPEHLLLDVGVKIFDPGFEYLDEEKSLTTPSVRKAEGVHAARNVTQTLKRTGNWGSVQIIPTGQNETDVYVAGQIVNSDGETLTVKVTVTDSANNKWYTRSYTDKLSQYAYDPTLRQKQEPFQRLYNDIANDMEQYIRRIEPKEREKLRVVSKLRFAQRFAPNDYNDFLEIDSGGKYTLKHAPANGDPIMAHIDSIRIRDQMFIERLQDYYENFNRRMQIPYDQWREASYHETKALRKIKKESTVRKIGGALAVIAGIFAQGSSSHATRTAGVLGIGGGAYMFKSGLDRGSEARLHEEGLKEMADSLGAEISPHTIALEDKTVTLSGTVDEQYAQWRNILNEIYLIETGQQPGPGELNPQQ
ncbi:MAG TPA: hypothetical protein DGR97_05325 [Gammaproteobacteria bacterium]|nr:hypothetical protein [Gammaproteobacteria bacterium]